jgi:hypothetical protein
MSSDQRRAAASAMAAIAAGRDASDIDQGDLEPTEAAVLVTEDGPAEPGPEAATAAGVATAIDTTAPDGSRAVTNELPAEAESPDFVTESPVEAAAEEPSRAPRRRGRRSATRPAGPPVPVG